MHLHLNNLLWIVSSSSNTSKHLTWTSDISVDFVDFSSLKVRFCNLRKRVVLPAPAHPTIIHLTWQTVNSPLQRNVLSFCSSICISFTSSSVWIFFLGNLFFSFQLPIPKSSTAVSSMYPSSNFNSFATMFSVNFFSASYISSICSFSYYICSSFFILGRHLFISFYNIFFDFVCF